MWDEEGSSARYAKIINTVAARTQQWAFMEPADSPFPNLLAIMKEKELKVKSAGLKLADFGSPRPYM